MRRKIIMDGCLRHSKAARRKIIMVWLPEALEGSEEKNYNGMVA
jgi:hypothetical protein